MIDGLYSSKVGLYKQFDILFELVNIVLTRVALPDSHLRSGGPVDNVLGQLGSGPAR